LYLETEQHVKIDRYNLFIYINSNMIISMWLISLSLIHTHTPLVSDLPYLSFFL
jgi:hypothetical protein